MLAKTRSLLRAEHDLEVSLAMITDSVRRTTIFDLVRVSPALVKRTVPREAGLARTLLGTFAIWHWISSNADILVAAFHDGEIVGRAILAHVFGVSEFEQSLDVPLRVSAPFCMSRQAHSKSFVWSWNRQRFLRCDVSGLGHLDHLEGSSDLVESDLLLEWTVVPHMDLEVVGGSCFEGSIRDGGVLWSRSHC